MVAPPRWGRPVTGNDWSQLAGQVAGTRPAVSVIVVHYEQARQLTRTLLALTRQDYPDVEVIVVDDGSPRPPSVPAGVQLLVQPRERARRSAARNRGVQASSGEVLCFLDADTVPEPGYITALTRLPALAPEVVAVGCRRHARLDAVAPEAPIETAGPANELSAPHWLAEGYGATHDLLAADSRSFRLMISAVLSATRWFYDEVGGFDETFDAYGGEDWEWAHRAWLGGAIFAHVPEAVAWHDGPDWEARQLDAAGRAAARAEKNAEAMRLAQRINVAGHRPRGLLGDRPEALIQIDPRLSAAAAFVCVDSLLQALPRSVVVVPGDRVQDYGNDPRVVAPWEGGPTARTLWPALRMTVHAAFTADGDGLAELCEAMLERDDGVCRLDDGKGPLMTIESARHRIRLARWGQAGGLPVRQQHPHWLLRLTDPPDVEAYLGGWQR